MELRHLRYLIAVAEERSFVAAATRLALAQPALSRQIRDLEKEIGTDLFLREPSGTKLTAAGQECVRAAREILENVSAALRRARLAEHGLIGRCVMGVGRYPLWNGLIARIVDQARQDYPGIDVVVEECTTYNQWQALVDAKVDIAVGSAPAIEYMQCAAETYSLDPLDSIVVARTHRLASHTSVTVKDLEQETWIRLQPTNEDEATRNLHAVLARMNFLSAGRRYATNVDSQRMMVRAGNGWAALPHSLRATLSSGLVAVPFESLAVPLRYVFMHRRGDTRPAVLSLLKSIRRSARRAQDANAAKEPPSGIRVTDSEQPQFASRIELRHLRYFTAIVQYESIGRAAEALALTQPALSRQLRDLETEVGVELLTRNARGVVPTLAGEAFNSDALAILRAADNLSQEAQRALRGTAGDCVIGTIPGPLVWSIVTSAVADCAARLPAIDIRLEEVPTPSQTSALLQGKIDVAIGRRYPTVFDLDPGIARNVLYPDVLNVALVSENHPLAKRRDIKLQDLTDVPFLFMSRDFSPTIYDNVMSRLTRAGYTPRIDGEYSGMSTCWALAAQGLGWVIGSQSQLGHAPHGLVALQIMDFEMPYDCELVYRRDEKRGPVLEVIAAMRRAANTLNASMASQENKYWSDIEESA